MKKNFFANKNLLITGGTGSYGRALVEYLVKNKFPLNKIIVFSRDELKQYEMNKIFDKNKYKNIRYILGDIREKDRLKIVLQNVDIVIHAAALKQVPVAEYNPFEFIKTNVLGAQNLVECCLNSSVSKVIALSTDKASSPINLYGATKLCSDKIFISANNVIGNQKIKFSVVRYGNVMGSRGSVLQHWLDQKKTGHFSVTNINMTRFHISLSQAIDLSIYAMINSEGGEIFVPKIPSYKLVDLARAINDRCRLKIVGLREGEKLHEEMISLGDSLNTYDIGKYYVITNKLNSIYRKNKKVKQNFSFTSNNNKFLNVAQLKKIIKETNLY
jgi:UDP-N-acetylglucosamine 4,6-dehydratase